MLVYRTLNTAGKKKSPLLSQNLGTHLPVLLRQGALPAVSLLCVHGYKISSGIWWQRGSVISYFLPSNLAPLTMPRVSIKQAMCLGGACCTCSFKATTSMAQESTTTVKSHCSNKNRICHCICWAQQVADLVNVAYSCSPVQTKGYVV